MPFFSNLADKISGYTLQLTIMKAGDKLTVMVYPKISESSEVQGQIVPISMTGTPTELDQQFFATLTTVFEKTKDIANQIKNFEKSMDKANEKAAKESKTSVGDAKKPADKPKDQPAMKFKTDKPADEKVNEDTGEINETTASKVEVGSPVVKKDPVSPIVPEESTSAAVTESEPEPETDATPDNGVADDSGSGQEAMNQDEDW